jgi:hypothetical protein
VAFIADHYGSTTRPIICALWCSGFTVPTETLRSAWLESIERVLKIWSKQDKFQTSAIVTETYFENLSDSFHGLATYAAKMEPPLTNPFKSVQYETTIVAA